MMRRVRRLLLIDRAIPFLAALVGLIALAGALLVQLNAEQQLASARAEVTALRTQVATLDARAAALAGAADDGTAAGLLALQERMQKLEAAAAASAEVAARPVDPAPDDAAPTETDVAAAPDRSLPLEDCIPPGTRFMAVPNETYPICQTKAVVKTGAITADSVDVAGAGTIVETGFGTLSGTACTVTVYTADVEGFADMRVTCS